MRISLLLIILFQLLFLSKIDAQITTSKHIASLNVLVHNAKTAEDSLDYLNSLILAWARIQKDSALFYLKAYKVLAVKASDSLHLARAAGHESGMYLKNGNIAMAIQAANHRIEIGRAMNHLNTLANAYSNLGNAYQQGGELDSALIEYEKGLVYAKKGKFKITEAKVLINISETYQFKGNYVKALQKAQEVIELCKQYKYTGYYASNHNLLGSIYLKILDYSKAEANFKQAIFFAKKYNNLNRLAISYELLAECLIANQAYKEAEKNLKASIEVGKASNIRIAEGRALGKLAKLYQMQGLNQAALELAQKGEQLLLKQDAVLELIDVHRIVGDIYNQLAIYSKAEEACLKAQQLNQLAHQKKDEMEICFCLYQASKGMGKPTIALQYIERYNSVKDSLMNFTISRKITQLEYQKIYDSKVFSDSVASLKKLAEQDLTYQEHTAEQKRLLTITRATVFGVSLILIFVASLYFLNKRKKQELELKNELIGDQKNTIEKSLYEKEILLKEIHHRVKNNLQIILGLLELQSNSIEESEASKALLEGKSRVKSMALIHQKLYQTENIAVVDVKDYLKDLVLYIQELYPARKNVRIEINIENIHLDIDTVIPLALILNELLSNSYKYAFEKVDNPQIKVEILPIKEGEYQLNYSDNGKGLPENFDLKKLKSLGMKLIKRLTKQLFGRFKIIDENGLHFSISFKNTDLRKETE